MPGKILIVSDYLRYKDLTYNKPLSGLTRALIDQTAAAIGIQPSQIDITCIHQEAPRGSGGMSNIPKLNREKQLSQFKEKSFKQYSLIMPAGDYPLEVLTRKKSISKWHCSPIQTTAEFGLLNCIPIYNPETAIKFPERRFYLSVAFDKARRLLNGELNLPEIERLLNPDLEAVHEFLDRSKEAQTVSVDIESGRGQINTFGLAYRHRDRIRACAINVLPDRCGAYQFYRLWQKIRDVISPQGGKRIIAQNALYEQIYLQMYGLYMAEAHHDTMLCQKFLQPEFEMGLHEVGRVHTDLPYWKDDKSNWNNIRDWQKHYHYNTSDTAGTLLAYESQLRELKERGLDELFYSYIMKLLPVVREMCSRGIAIDLNALDNLRENITRKQEHLLKNIQDQLPDIDGSPCNPKSPQQLKQSLQKLGCKIPTTKDRKTGRSRETTNKSALVKLAKKYPKKPVLKELLEYSRVSKLISSYLSFTYSNDQRVRYMLNAHGTETGRFSGHMDPWGNGFNPQTVPKFVRQIFCADPGCTLIQIDLKQAESRYVAWDAPEPTLMGLIEEGRDIHKYVASRIFNKPEEIVTKRERNLGKKSGHASNYCVGPRTFADQCLTDMNLALKENEARQILQSYFQVFPGIKRRQLNIQEEVRRYRKLTTPLGRVRQFWGRIDDSAFRQAYAYCPQSTIPDIINHLIFHLQGHCQLLLQVHDSVLLQVETSRVTEIVDRAFDLKSWHPEIFLRGGQLIIPIDVEVGANWKEMYSV